MYQKKAFKKECKSTTFLSLSL
ncbi:MAG: hypothetical protein RL757_1255, partial [Bacteroidota bacterium]